MAQLTEIIQLARAKINLCLHVTGRRADGYHLLSSIVVFPEIGDEIRVSPANNISLSIDGPFGPALADQNNLVLKAANILAKSPGAAIHLTKNLPVSSGIGGGSSDAAATLIALSKLWKTPLPSCDDILKLGADVPLCMSEKPQLLQGIGEVLSPLSGMPKFAILLVNAGIPVSTKQVFEAMGVADNSPIEPWTAPKNLIDLVGYLRRQRNDMQLPASSICPEINRVIEALENTPDCLFSRMSGSGGTCFGLFQTIKQADLACANIKKSNPGWWVVAAMV